ncbi:MAG: GNAT family N-acetyltransferase [Ferruginibacter sp.]
MAYTITKDGFSISDDKLLLDIHVIHHYLSKESYWSKNIPLQVVQKSIDGSVCFGIYEGNKQIGFARVITDKASFGYLADVFILNAYRGKGLSKWLMKCILEHPELQNFRRWMLATKDAHGLYSQFGFKPLEQPERIMGLLLFSEYPAQTIKEENNS